MELEGEHRIPMPRAQVWAALNDPETLRACIPGCKDLTKTSDTGFAARVVSKIGPVSASLAGTVDLSDIDPGRAYTITGSGQGGVAGFAKGGARISLADDGDAATVLTYTGSAEIGGKLASVGSRMLQSAARKTADAFFTAFVARLTGTGPQAEAVNTQTTTETPAIPAWQQSAPFPAHIKVEFGDIRIVTQTPWMTLAALAGWLVAAALAFHAFR